MSCLATLADSRWRRADSQLLLPGSLLIGDVIHSTSRQSDNAISSLVFDALFAIHLVRYSRSEIFFSETEEANLKVKSASSLPEGCSIYLPFAIDQKWA